MKDQVRIYKQLNLQKKFIASKKPKSLEEFFRAEEKFIQRLGKEGCVLDAGCGDGRHLSLIADNIKIGVGIDYNPKAIKEAKKKNGSIKNLKFYVADIFDITFPKNYFDLVLCLNNTFGNLPKLKPALRELLRVVKPGGKIFLTVHNNKIKDDKIAWYREVGLKKPIYSERFGMVITEEGFFSYCFKKSYLSDIFKQFSNISFRISNLTHYSFLCIIYKK